MDRSKLYIILAVLVGLLLIFMILNAVFSEDNQPVFQDALGAQGTAIALSDVAVSQATEPDTRALASSIVSTTSSDRNGLNEFYQTTYGEAYEVIDEEAVGELEQTSENFDQAYRESVLKYLKFSHGRLEILQSRFTNEELNAIIEQSKQNHEAQIQTLQEKQP